MRLWRSNNLSLYPLSIPVFLTAAVLALYYPTLFSGLNSIDDPRIILHYSVLPPLRTVFLPGNHYYFRPIIEFSYYLDSLLWDFEPRVMHLENILIHVANVNLVYLLARRLVRESAGTEGTASLGPLFAALLCAFHPLNVEAVSWIAGRTDPLAALFLLCATLFWLHWVDTGGWRNAACTLLFFLLGMLTKEVAIAFLPVSILLVLGWQPATATACRRHRVAAFVIGAGLVLLLIAFGLALWGTGTSFDRFVSKVDGTILLNMRDLCIAFGFYVKKLFIPIPLSFAITQVSPYYAFLGGAALLVILTLLRRWRVVSLLFAASALMTMPALLVAVRQVAWTPYAERYMYLPVAFVALGVGGMTTFLQKKLPFVAMALVVVLLTLFAAVSLQRTLLWQDNLAFYRNAVYNSPQFGAVHNELGAVLLERGSIDDAAKEFEIADRLNRRDSLRLLIKTNMMRAKVAKGDFAGARGYFFQLFGKKKDAPVEFLDLLQKADGKRLGTLAPEDRVALAIDIMTTLDVLYDKDRDPFWLYRSGQMALIAGLRHEAAVLFRRAYAAAPPDAHYRTAAQKHTMYLEGGR